LDSSGPDPRFRILSNRASRATMSQFARTETRGDAAMTTQLPPQAIEGLASDAWEFTTADFSKPSRDIVALNRLGADGWEAVSMVTTWGVSEMRFVHPIVLLKRPLPRAND
jgi:hypothetical protein